MEAEIQFAECVEKLKDRNSHITCRALDNGDGDNVSKKKEKQRSAANFRRYFFVYNLQEIGGRKSK